MSARSLPPPITVEQYERFAGYPGLKDELIYGEIVMSPQPKPLHQQLAENLQRLLATMYEPLGYVAKQNSNLRFGAAHSMPAPDVLVVPLEAWREACRKEQYLSTPPLVVAEILSPSNRSAVMARKVRLYLEQGVEMVLVVQPKQRQVICHSASQEAFVASAEDQITLPLAGVASMTAVFAF